MYGTQNIERELDNCEDLEDFIRTVIPKLQTMRTMWQQKMERILANGNFSVKSFARLCRVSEPTVRKWRSGSLPQSRDTYIRIGFAAGYDLDEMNRFLKRYGRCPQLYVKSLEDSVCIFVLNSRSIPHTYDAYQDVLKYVSSELESFGAPSEEVAPTVRMSQLLANVATQEELLAFLGEHRRSYLDGFRRLYNYILLYLDLNLQSIGDDSAASFHAMAQESQWSSSLRHCISEIRNRKWFPLRQKILSLGVHLNMDVDCINEMLEKAQMEPLYVKNPVEAAVKFAIEDAKIMSEEDAIIPDGSDGLCRYVKNVLEQIDLPEAMRLMDDL